MKSRPVCVTGGVRRLRRRSHNRWSNEMGISLVASEDVVRVWYVSTAQGWEARFLNERPLQTDVGCLRNV